MALSSLIKPLNIPLNLLQKRTFFNHPFEGGQRGLFGLYLIKWYSFLMQNAEFNEIVWFLRMQNLFDDYY